MLRNELVITNNSFNSLFSIPRNKRFVCMNTDPNLRADSVTEAVNRLGSYISKKEKEKNQMVFRSDTGDETDSDDEIRPFKGFAKPLSKYKNIEEASESTQKANRLLELINEHVDEALQTGFDDSIAKFKGKSHFVIPSSKAWFEFFMFLHRIFIDNPNNSNFEPNDPDYKAYLDNFVKIVDIDDRYFTECTEYGLELAIENYKEMLPHFYSKKYHDQKILQSMSVLQKYGRGPNLTISQQQLTEICNEIWLKGGRQQCEVLSLTGNPCAMPKHLDNDEGHNSGETIISTCNCGRTQGRRSDPYTVRQANYEFYEIMKTKCSSCAKLETISFAVFEPSINDYRAADVVRTFANIQNVQPEDEDDDYQVIPSQSQLANQQISIGPTLSPSPEEENHNAHNEIVPSIKKTNENLESDHEILSEAGSDAEDVGSIREIVIQVGGEENDEEAEKTIFRQPSTTEYLSGMLHTLSPGGLLPQFPSWSLVCIGHSSIYSHNLGLPEHSQSGFLTGANFLLPWDVQVRLENAGSWARSLGRTRNRRRAQPVPRDVTDETQNVFMLKIFIGCEYECPCGHRFFLSSPDTILRGISGIAKDAGSKIVFNDMPLYFPCPCRNTKPRTAQLMRVHIVTPKAPVNIIIEPKVRTGNKINYTFLPGSDEPTKLSQSAYWILRLPYIYEGNDGPIMPPIDISKSNHMTFGCLLAGMYGIVETRSK